MIDPTDYKIALKLAEAAVERAQTTAQNAEVEAETAGKLTDLAVTKEEQQTYDANATAATAQYHQAVADRDQAQVNLDRTQIRSPVNGWVTNLLARVGDYATVGRSVISGRRCRLLLGRCLFRGNATRRHSRGRSRQDQADGL